jgi:hypothetical protein
MPHDDYTDLYVTWGIVVVLLIAAACLLWKNRLPPSE